MNNTRLNLNQFISEGAFIGDSSIRWNVENRDWILFRDRGYTIINLDFTIISVRRATLYLYKIFKTNCYSRIFVVTDYGNSMRSLLNYYKFLYTTKYKYGFIRNYWIKYRKLLQVRFGSSKFMGLLYLFKWPSIFILLNTSKKKFNVCIKEINRLSIPTVALMNTSSTAKGVQYPIFSDDKSFDIKALYLELFSNAIKCGRLDRLKFEFKNIQTISGDNKMNLKKKKHDKRIKNKMNLKKKKHDKHIHIKTR
jgi:ribosomal protein S2